MGVGDLWASKSVCSLVVYRWAVCLVPGDDARAADEEVQRCFVVHSRVVSRTQNSLGITRLSEASRSCYAKCSSEIERSAS